MAAVTQTATTTTTSTTTAAAITSITTPAAGGRKTIRSNSIPHQTCHQQYRRYRLRHPIVSYLTILGGFLPILYVVGCFGGSQIASANLLTPRSEFVHRNDSGICRSVDIRNTLDTFKRLEGCRVVEGFVQILLFDKVNETQMSLITFPELTEITDYLLLYRVNGLRSIGQLFPNLAVIRGQNLFFNYALIVFEMSSLQEIALYSLTDITHGLVRIDKNPSLCYVHSINWAEITHEKGEHFIKNLKPKNECPICPGASEKNLQAAGLKACPVMPHKSLLDPLEKNVNLCWNRQHCQKICPKNCRSCNDLGECCSDNCIGGCSLNNTNECTVCRNLTMDFGDHRECLFRCPDNYFEYLGRRCITQEQCIAMRRPIELHSRTDNEFPFKIFQGKCVMQCPTNYMSENHECKPCAGKCKKECPGANIDSIMLSRQLRGCTHIKGSLEIQIRGGRKVVTELEENLSMIEEIDGYLKIVRSFPLVSLNFFKNLKIIRGKYLESKKYVFVVLDNQNLQDLWNWENRTLRIENGRLFFHFNPKLCLEKIETLQKIANLGNYTDLEVAPNSNGDKIACDLEHLRVRVIKLYSTKVDLNWPQYTLLDQRKLLGYIVYHIGTIFTNITLYDGRDACGGDGWEVSDVASVDNEKLVKHTIQKLNPYTLYALYVRTYTIATERKGAQSDIIYFKTLPSMPSAPRSLQVSTNASDTLKITWLPPMYSNGNVTYFIVSGKRRPVKDQDEVTSQDHCSYRTTTPKHQIIQTPMIFTPNRSDTCPCEDRTPVSINEWDEASRIDFENFLQNEVYVRKDEREKREVSYMDFYDQYRLGDEIGNVTENGTNNWESFSFKVYGKFEHFVDNLHHYSDYDISVVACREREGDEDVEELCSNTSIKTGRTQFKEGADDIKRVQIANQSMGLVSVTWDEPPNPNGIINSYTIEYKMMDNENSKPTSECITHARFLSQGRIHTLDNFLLPGNYSLRVYATSAVGNGKSDIIYFNVTRSTSKNSWLISLLALIIPAVLCIGYYYNKKRRAARKNVRLITSINPEYVPTVYVPDEWEVARRNIELKRELGQGSFGMVYEGVATDIRGHAQLKCAVKTVNENATNRERLEFLNEASVMKAFDTTHVVRLLGVVSQGQPTLVIMELMACGDLKTYLRSHRPNGKCLNDNDDNNDDDDDNEEHQPPTLNQIMRMALEIADGMAYLAAKKFVHRDLAARNCMVAEDLTVKIGDFGMTRDIYETDYYRKGTKGLLPVRWMAPESLKDGVFTSASDVWSYGVVLWEMATLSMQPYQGLSNDQVLRYVIDGGVMEQPENCPEKFYMLMRECWHHKPTSRPPFIGLVQKLLEENREILARFAQVSFYHSPAGIEVRQQRMTTATASLTSTVYQDDDDPSTPLHRPNSDSQFSLRQTAHDSEDEFSGGNHTHFPSIHIESKDGLANGFVSGANNATTEC